MPQGVSGQFHSWFEQMDQCSIVEEEDSRFLYLLTDSPYAYVETADYAFMENIAEYVKSGAESFGIDIDGGIYLNLDVRWLGCNDILTEKGSGKILLSPNVGISYSSRYVFEKYGLKFSSSEYLNGFYKSIGKQAYILGGELFRLPLPYYEWEFEIFCGKIVQAFFILEDNQLGMVYYHNLISKKTTANGL